jgi:hypothetical protein
VIANDWTDLTDGSLFIPIDLDEIGDTRDLFTGVWTGTTITGAPSLCDCGSWVGDDDNCPTDIAPGEQLAGTIGDPLANTEHWSDLSLQLVFPVPPFPPEFSRCDTPHGLYCFEQLTSALPPTPDIPGLMSAFRLFTSALPPGADIPVRSWNDRL